MVLYFFNTFTKLPKGRVIFRFFHVIFQQLVKVKVDNIDLNFHKKLSDGNENKKILLQIADWNENDKNALVWGNLCCLFACQFFLS